MSHNLEKVIEHNVAQERESFKEFVEKFFKKITQTSLQIKRLMIL